MISLSIIYAENGNIFLCTSIDMIDAINSTRLTSKLLIPTPPAHTLDGTGLQLDYFFTY